VCQAETHSVSAAAGKAAKRPQEFLMADHHLSEHLLVYVEIPKGSRNKYEYDEGIGEVILDRFLSSSMVYPTDYGFLIGHRGRDEDPLDALVCVSEPTFPGCVIAVKPIALFKMRDEKGEDDKIVCVPTHDPGWNHAETLDDIPEQLQREITHFFSSYKQLEDKAVEVDGWHSREEALEVIEDGRRLQEEYDAEAGEAKLQPGTS
jgi:inorganic pyrophosphatase